MMIQYIKKLFGIKKELYNLNNEEVQQAAYCLAMNILKAKNITTSAWTYNTFYSTCDNINRHVRVANHANDASIRINDNTTINFNRRYCKLIKQHLKKTKVTEKEIAYNKTLDEIKSMVNEFGNKHEIHTSKN